MSVNSAQRHGSLRIILLLGQVAGGAASNDASSPGVHVMPPHSLREQVHASSALVSRHLEGGLDDSGDTLEVERVAQERLLHLVCGTGELAEDQRPALRAPRARRRFMPSLSGVTSIRSANR
jgi:hypothetical protein